MRGKRSEEIRGGEREEVGGNERELRRIWQLPTWHKCDQWHSFEQAANFAANPVEPRLDCE